MDLFELRNGAPRDTCVRFAAMARCVGLVALCVAVATFAMAEPVSAGSSNSELFGVDCPSSTSCFAVGDVAGRKPLVMDRASGSWQTMSTPVPAGTTENVLHGISCPTTTSCVAVGASSTPTSLPALVMRMTATTWSEVATPKPAAPAGKTVQGWGLNAVSCLTASGGSIRCIAVGSVSISGKAGVLAERFDGTHWALMTTPQMTGEAMLDGISCSTIAPANCFAVGQQTASGASKSLIEHLNGATWTKVASPNPQGAEGVNLNGVSCIVTTNCWAAGDNLQGAVEQSILEHWNGAKWSLVSASFPTKSHLDSISCVSVTSCMAVGAQRAGTGYSTFAERWNGSKWTTVSTPNRSEALVDALAGVACAAAANCHAVGYNIPNTRSQPVTTLTMHWNGTKWSLG